MTFTIALGGNDGFSDFEQAQNRCVHFSASSILMLVIFAGSVFEVHPKYLRTLNLIRNYN